MSYRDLLAEAKKGFPAAAYLFSASDRFLLSEAVSLLKRGIPDDQRDFLFHLFDLQSTEADRLPVEQIIDVLNTVPFFGGRKIVVVDNAQKLLKKDLGVLARYLAAPSESSLLALLHAGTVKKEQKEGLKAARHLILDLAERDIPRWLVEKAKVSGLSLPERTASSLLSLIGPDLGMLSSELDKLLALGKEKVTDDDLAEIVESKRTYNAFALIDAIRAGRTEEAFRIYHLLRETDEPYSLLGALNWHYSRLFEGKTNRQDRDRAARVFGLLHEADAGTKTTGGGYPLELLLMKLMQLDRPVRAKARR